MADRETAGGVLGLVQSYVNTADLEDGTDQLNDPNTLAAWLVARGLMSSGEASEADVKHAIAVREAIRGVIGANTGAAVYPVDIATLNGAAGASRLRARFAYHNRVLERVRLPDGYGYRQTRASPRAHWRLSGGPGARWRDSPIDG